MPDITKVVPIDDTQIKLELNQHYYIVYSDGSRIFSSYNNGDLSFSENKDGYYKTVSMTFPGDSNSICEVHKIVYRAFIGPVPDGWEIHHTDGNNKNNNVKNLEAVDENTHKLYHILLTRRKYLPENRCVLSNLDLYEFLTEYGQKFGSKKNLLGESDTEITIDELKNHSIVEFEYFREEDYRNETPKFTKITIIK